MAESDEPRTVAHAKERMRPRSPGVGGALVVMAVVVVIFLGLALWVGVGGFIPGRAGPAAHEAVHTVTERMASRWPQVPGPPQRYLEESWAAQVEGRADDAARRLGMALALDPEHDEALLRLVILDARGTGAGLLEPGEGASIVEVFEEAAPDAPLLPAAKAWRALAESRPDDALTALGEVGGEPEAAWARLRADPGAETAPDAAATLMAAWPGHPEACAAAVRVAWRDGDLFGVEAAGEACVAAGTRSTEVLRGLADVADRLGDTATARQRYREAGLVLHAAAVASQTGRPLEAEEAEALRALEPPAQVHRLWHALATGDAEAAQAAVSALELAGPLPPPMRVAKAAGEAWLKRPATAEQTLEGQDGVWAAIVREAVTADAEVAAAARADQGVWPDHPVVSGPVDDPVAAALGSGVADRLVPLSYLRRAPRAPGQPLGVARLVPTPSGAGTVADGLVMRLVGDPEAVVGGELGAVGDEEAAESLPALAARATVALAPGAPAGAASEALTALSAAHPDAVATRFLRARAQWRLDGDHVGAEASLQALAAERPELVGVLVERYRVRADARE